VLGVSHVPTDHGMIAGSGDSSQNASEPIPIKPLCNFEHDNDNINGIDALPDQVAENVTGWVSGLQDEVGGDNVKMHWNNAVGDNSSLPPECILYFKGCTFEIMEFVLESPVAGVIGSQGQPTDKFLEGEFILCVACISKQQSSKNTHKKHHLVCPLSKDYHKAIQEKCLDEVEEQKKSK